MNFLAKNVKRYQWFLMLLAILSVLVVAGSTRATAQTWQSSYANGNLQKWNEIHCGGQGTTCPCNPPSNPSGAAAYTQGSCKTTSTGAFPQPPDGSGRYQLVSAPGNHGGTVLKVNLQHNDLWLTNWTRNEVVAAQETPGVATYWTEGDDRYFAWSTWFDPVSFASFSCGSTACSSNPWNVFTQFHQAGDNYSPPMGFVLRASTAQSGKYQAQFVTKDKYDSDWTNEHIQYTWDTLPTGVWNDFVLHVKFSTSASTGVVELWYGTNGGAKTHLTLACPDSSGTARNLATCPTTTLYTWPAPGDYNYYSQETYTPRTPGTAMPNYIVQGLYRQNDVLDNVTLYHADLIIGTTYAQVAGTQSALFSDNFNRTTGLGSSWSVQHGSYSTDGSFAVSGTPPIQGSWAMLNPSLNTNNYSVTADLIVPSGSLYSGLVARSSDTANFDRNLYAAQIATDGKVYLYRRNEWNWTQLASASAGIVANTSYNLKLVVTGSSPTHLEVWLNGVQKIAFNDSSTSQITSGVPGMENYDAGVKYDNFTVTAP